LIRFDEPNAAWQFTQTKWHTVADKDKFARHYIAFVQARCPATKFHEWFYNRLMHMFMHIAHFNRIGFYETWCDTPEKRFALLRHHANFDCLGDPAWTWSDVERTLQGWIVESGILREYEFEASAARHEQTLCLARAALRELSNDDVIRLFQERNMATEHTNENEERGASAQRALRGEQAVLFQL
jgi:hypothetical protein